MSPEIRINGLIIAKVPDESGVYNTLKGKLLYVNTDGIDADANNQRIILEAEEIGGRRELRLTCEGIGNSSKRAGDKKSPEIDVELLDRPIRVTYNLYGDEYGPRVTRRNPRWIRTDEDPRDAKYRHSSWLSRNYGSHGYRRMGKRLPWE